MYNHALTDVPSTEAGIKCLYCMYCLIALVYYYIHIRAMVFSDIALVDKSIVYTLYFVDEWFTVVYCFMH